MTLGILDEAADQFEHALDPCRQTAWQGNTETAMWPPGARRECFAVPIQSLASMAYWYGFSMTLSFREGCR
jgi:hypothetical protein